MRILKFSVHNTFKCIEILLACMNKFWWEPSTLSLYLTDLIVLTVRTQYFTKLWKVHMIAHHLFVGLLFIAFNHTIGVYVDHILFIIMLFLNSNTATSLSPIWRTFKFCHYQYATIVCFIAQRTVRWMCLIWMFVYIPLEWLWVEPYNYWIIVSAIVVLEIFDIYFQCLSIIRYYKKSKRAAKKNQEI